MPVLQPPVEAGDARDTFLPPHRFGEQAPESVDKVFRGGSGPAVLETRVRVNPLRRWTRSLVRGRVRALSRESVDVTDEHDLGATRTGSQTLRVSDSRFYRRAILGGSMGFAESYIQGEWNTSDLTQLLSCFARHSTTLRRSKGTLNRALAPLRSLAGWMRRNSIAGSRRNIAAHYDLSNDFFQLMLDPTMTYSAGIFLAPDNTLEEASREKYDRICRKLQLSVRDHVLEIGTGWGGFAIHAAQRYGCRVTTTTISAEQFEFARERIRQEGLESLVQVVKQDYRELSGRYDKLVSIEMIEAVGRKYLHRYFAKCSQLLAADGMMVLQAITIPDERYEAYSRSTDFIQRYIFPGGFLPSFSAIGGSLRKSTDLRVFHTEDFGPHYGETLKRWRENFEGNLNRVRELGFDERFIRMWRYYLCYCEAGFQTRQIGLSQLLLTKPANRREPLLSPI